MKLEKLIDNLSLDYEWAEANEWESPIQLTDDLAEAMRILKMLQIIIEGVS